MINLPQKIQENLLPNQISNITNWWDELSLEEQQIISILYNETDLEEGVSIELCGEFIDEEDDFENEFWTIGGLYQYLVNHEIYLKDFSIHVGGVCSAHQQAITVGQKGIIPAHFHCPLQNKACPMLQLLKFSPNQSLKLSAKLTKHIVS